MMLFLSSVIAALLSAGTVHAAGADLSISAADVSFSEDLIAGEHLRIYAAIENVGDEDVDGYVSFFQGSLPIGDSQVISVRADGSPEDVYVDFVVPSGAFNIRAEIRGTDPADANSNNDVAITKLFTPKLDGDRDGVDDGKDNCPSDKNTDQKDADKDGDGDACDEDDDNDSLTDSVEAELGTNPRVRDTDGDGVEDPSDAYPIDASRSVIAAPTPVAKLALAEGVAQAQAPEPEPEPVSDTTTDDSEVLDAEPEIVPEAITVSGEGPSYPNGVSMNAVFRYVRTDWNTFQFEAVAPETPGERVEWDFGDGVTSNRRSVEHAYRTSGDFHVTFTRIAPDGTSSEDTTDVSVALFSLRNGLIRAMVGALATALALALLTFVVLAWKSRRRASDFEDPLEDATEDMSEVTKLAVRDADDADMSEDDALPEEEPVEDTGVEEIEESDKTDVKEKDDAMDETM